MSAESEIQIAPPICTAPAIDQVAPPVCPHDSTGRVTVGGESLNSFLCSAIAHLMILIVLALMVASVRNDQPLVLSLLTANTAADAKPEAIETIKLAPTKPDNDPLVTPVEPAAALEMLVTEPTLLPVSGADGQRRGLGERAEGGAWLGQEADQVGTFFGAKAFGNEFVYVIDNSTSMGYPSQYGETRFQIACKELVRSINQLKPEQSFCVFVFCYRTRTMFGESPSMLPATTANKRRIANWIHRLGLGPGTDPRYGTMMALRLNPDAIFLLSDGEFNGQHRNAHRIRRNVPIETLIENERKTAIPIHTIAFEDLLNRKRLRRISNTTGGTHRFVGRVSRVQLIIDDLSGGNDDDVVHGLLALIHGTRLAHDPRAMMLVTATVTNKLRSKDPDIRRLAHQALRVLADGEDLGPHNSEPKLRDYLAAEKEWIRFWKTRLGEGRTL